MRAAFSAVHYIWYSSLQHLVQCTVDLVQCTAFDTQWTVTFGAVHYKAVFFSLIFYHILLHFITSITFHHIVFCCCLSHLSHIVSDQAFNYSGKFFKTFGGNGEYLWRRWTLGKTKGKPKKRDGDWFSLICGTPRAHQIWNTMHCPCGGNAQNRIQPKSGIFQPKGFIISHFPTVCELNYILGMSRGPKV